MNDFAIHISNELSLPLSKVESAISSFTTNSKNYSMVEEPMAAYLSSASRVDEADGQHHIDILENISMRHSDSSALLNELFNVSDLSLKFIAESVFEMTPKTLAKYKNESLELPQRISEIAIKLIHLYGEAKEVFGDAKSFNIWSSKESVGLDFNIPKNYFATATGIDYVYGELQRISQGYPI